MYYQTCIPLSLFARQHHSSILYLMDVNVFVNVQHQIDSQ